MRRDALLLFETGMCGDLRANAGLAVINLKPRTSFFGRGETIEFVR